MPLHGLFSPSNRLTMPHLRQQLESTPNHAPSAGMDALDAKFIQFEERLYSVRVTGGQDSMRWPAGLMSKLAHVASQAQEADFRPTNQEVAVNAMFTQEIKSWQPELAQLDPAVRDLLLDQLLPRKLLALGRPRQRP